MIDNNPLIRPLTPSGGASLQPRHHPEHRPGRGNRPRRSRAVLRAGEDESPQRALPGPKQEYGAEGLPRHVRGHLLLSVEEEPLDLRSATMKKGGQKCRFSTSQEGVFRSKRTVLGNLRDETARPAGL